MEKIMDWLKTYPKWGDGEITADYLSPEPGSVALYQQGLQETERKSDVLGNLTIGYRCRFLLRRMACPGDLWLEDFQNWVQLQSAQGLAPSFGDVPASERIWAENGKLVEVSQPGTGVYQVTLVVDFIKIYEEKDHGEN